MSAAKNEEAELSGGHVQSQGCFSTKPGWPDGHEGKTREAGAGSSGRDAAPDKSIHTELDRPQEEVIVGDHTSLMPRASSEEAHFACKTTMIATPGTGDRIVLRE